MYDPGSPGSVMVIELDILVDYTLMYGAPIILPGIRRDIRACFNNALIDCIIII